MLPDLKMHSQDPIIYVPSIILFNSRLHSFLILRWKMSIGKIGFKRSWEVTHLSHGVKHEIYWGRADGNKAGETSNVTGRATPTRISKASRRSKFLGSETSCNKSIFSLKFVISVFYKSFSVQFPSRASRLVLYFSCSCLWCSV